MNLLQSLSQNISIAVLEALAVMAVIAGIGWWIGRRSLNASIDAAQMKLATRQVELEMCRQSKMEGKVVEKIVQPPVLEFPIDIAPPEAIPGITAPPMAPILMEELDDLKVIEGIGPKIEQLLNNENITSFYQLSHTKPDRIREILLAAGSRFQTHDPTTWPDQARLAYEGRWEELKQWQDELMKGK